IILPNISPTNGMNTGSLNLIFSKIFMKINVPRSAKAKATNIFFSGLALVNMSSDTSTPNLAESIVPAVVGDTNLLRLSCCIIRSEERRVGKEVRVRWVENYLLQQRCR